jgi:cholesterol transport system auxiliary component
MKQIHILLILFILNACSLKESPPLKVYTLTVERITPVSHSIHRNKTIKVSFPQTLKEKISAKMNYSYSSSERGVYQNAQWSNNSAKLIQGNMIQCLEQSQIFRAVLPYESTAGEDYRLESSIFDFSHYVRGVASYAKVSIQLSLIDTYTGRLIKTKRFSYREDTKTTDAKGYVDATQRAMGRLSRDLVAWLR